MHKVYSITRKVVVNVNLEEVTALNPVLAVVKMDNIIDYEKLVRQILPEDLVLSVEYGKLEGALICEDGSDNSYYALTEEQINNVKNLR